VIDYYQNLDPPTEAQLAYMHDSLSKIKAFLDSQGVALVIVIPPNKVSIYPEALPSTVQLYSEKARLDQILDYLAVHPVAPIVDLRGRLIAAKAERLVYFPTDTHWTGYGAYIAYHATLSQVQQQFAAVRPYERDELIFSEAPREGGDLTKLLSLQDSYTEQRVSISVPLHLSQASLLDFWPSGDYTYYKTNDRGLPRAVILHDSFFQSLRPLIAEHFSWSTFKRWQPGYATIYRDVEQMTLREQPDVVILEIIERWVYQLLEPQFMTPVE
jgi:alginate O-acetyltransferase complex protein AlgJ